MLGERLAAMLVRAGRRNLSWDGRQRMRALSIVPKRLRCALRFNGILAARTERIHVMNAQPIEDGSHIFLHMNLCAAVVHAAERAPVPVRVRLIDRVDGVEFEKTIHVDRRDASQAVVEFDVHRGIFRLRIDAPSVNCNASDFLDFMPNSNRTITETLEPGPLAPTEPVTLLDGTAPVSFLYTKPTFAFFAPGLACDKPITTPLVVKSNVEYDQGAFHVWLYPGSFPAFATPTPPTPEPNASPSSIFASEAALANSIAVTLRLRTPTGQAHYVRVPIVFPLPWRGWPSHVQFNVSEELIDRLATEKPDVLLCTKLSRTITR